MKGYRRPPRCSFCSDTGHNRRSCEKLKTVKDIVVEKYKTFRAKWWEAYKNLPYGYGAIYKHVNGSYAYNEAGVWSRAELGKEIVHVVIGIYLPTYISDTGSIFTSPFSRIDAGEHGGYSDLPVVDGYFTKNIMESLKHGYSYHSTKWVFERRLLSFGATLADTVDRDKLNKWLEAQDVTDSYRFKDSDNTYKRIMESFCMDTELVS